MSRVTLAVIAVMLAAGPARAADPQPLWEVHASPPSQHFRTVGWVGFSPHGKRVAAWRHCPQFGRLNPLDANLEDKDRLLVWDVATHKEILNQEQSFGSPETPGVERAAMTAEGTLVIGAAQEVRPGDGKRMSVQPGLRESTVGAWINPKTRDALCLHGDEESEYRLRAGKLSAFDADPRARKTEPWPAAKLTHAKLGDTLRGAAANADLTRVAVVSERAGQEFRRPQTLALYGVAAGETLKLTELAAVPVPHRSPVMPARFSPDGRTLALGSVDCTVSLWDVADAGKDWKPRETIAAGRFTVSCLAFSPDGRTLVAGTYDSKAANLFLIDVRGGKLVASRTLGNAITALAYSPDGKTLATGDVDARTGVCKVRVWDAAALRGD